MVNHPNRNKKYLAPFKIGDKVSRKFDGRILTVVWISKGSPVDRREQFIATEDNSYCHPASAADLFEMAS